MKTPNLLVFGGPNSGKTHFAAQLVGRLKRNPGKLKIRTGDGSSTNWTMLEEVSKCLKNGNSAGHTPADQYSDILLPLMDEKKYKFDLHWPDYGGEQISALFKDREVTSDWKIRLEESNGWILFIRLSSEITYPDALEKLTSISATSSKETKRPDIWDANAYFIELVQILCHVAGLNITSTANKPPLAIALSCYDEIFDEKKTPSSVLQKKLPLFHSFILSTWPTERLSIWGVSSLGKALTPNSNDDEFLDDGPEKQGWIIAPNQNEKNSDLTAPLSWLLENI